MLLTRLARAAQVAEAARRLGVLDSTTRRRHDGENMGNPKVKTDGERVVSINFDASVINVLAPNILGSFEVRLAGMADDHEFLEDLRSAMLNAESARVRIKFR